MTIHFAVFRVSYDLHRCVGLRVFQPNLPYFRIVHLSLNVDLFTVATGFLIPEGFEFGLSEHFQSNVIVLMHHSELLFRFW